MVAKGATILLSKGEGGYEHLVKENLALKMSESLSNSE